MSFANARGEGQGIGGPRQGDGGAARCKCPVCGLTKVHERGTPCSSMYCPNCNVPMIGL